jgi:hypothetical protein
MKSSREKWTRKGIRYEAPARILNTGDAEVHRGEAKKRREKIERAVTLVML